MSLALARVAIDTEGRERGLDVSGELRGAVVPGRPDLWYCEVAEPGGRVHRFTVHLTPEEAPERPAVAACSLDDAGVAFALFGPTPALWTA